MKTISIYENDEFLIKITNHETPETLEKKLIFLRTNDILNWDKVYFLLRWCQCIKKLDNAKIDVMKELDDLIYNLKNLLLDINQIKYTIMLNK